MEYKTVSLADQVFERLEADILSGRFKRGETITELQLCAELGVSRTPVREALRRLYQEHLVEDSGKATVVLGISPQDFRCWASPPRTSGTCARSASASRVWPCADSLSAARRRP